MNKDTQESIELAEAYEMHDAAKGKDATQAFAHLIKATVITHLLEEIGEMQDK